MKFEGYLIESSLSRVYQHSQEHDIGTITAFRYAPDCGEGTPYTKSENRARNKQLMSRLKGAGYGITAAKGTYIENYGTKDAKEVGEEIFIVVDLKDTGNLKKDLMKFGAEFDQDSILYIPKGGKGGTLYGTNSCPNGYPGKGKSVKLGKALFGEKGEFFTKVNGRPFVLK